MPAKFFNDKRASDQFMSKYLFFKTGAPGCSTASGHCCKYWHKFVTLTPALSQREREYDCSLSLWAVRRLARVRVRVFE
jgi:hypothetical protein